MTEQMSHVLKPVDRLLVIDVEINKYRTAVINIRKKELSGLFVLQKDLLDIIESLVRQRDEADNK